MTWGIMGNVLPYSQTVIISTRAVCIRMLGETFGEIEWSGVELAAGCLALGGAPGKVEG